jgi:hypothetical protein
MKIKLLKHKMLLLALRTRMITIKESIHRIGQIFTRSIGQEYHTLLKTIQE